MRSPLLGVGRFRAAVTAVLLALAALAIGASHAPLSPGHEQVARHFAAVSFRASRFLAVVSALAAWSGWLLWQHDVYAELGRGYLPALATAVGACAYGFRRLNPKMQITGHILASVLWLGASLALLVYL